MKSFKMFASLLVAGLLLAACSLIPPQPVGANALGYDGQVITVGTPVIAGASLSPLAERSATVQFFFQDIEPPELPIGPSSLQAVQGFTATVAVTGSPTPLPTTITINSGSLDITISDGSGTPADVTAGADFGPFTLNRSASCSDTDSDCEYTFADASAAAESLTLTISGDDLSRLLQIITEGDATNSVSLNLTVDTDDSVDSLTFTIDVENNYIRF